jgi:hypothetical protein
MKLLIGLFLLLPFFAFAQQATGQFYKVNEREKLQPIISPDSLARQLTYPYTTDLEKVRAIFRWITENISYNIRPTHRIDNTEKSYILDDSTDTGPLKPLSERVAIDVLKRRIAFCDGYARLFTTLCTYAGIESEVITGYGNGSVRRKGRFGSNHRWNAVRIDSSWYLLDATWASGYSTYGSNDFIKSYNDFYFLTPPKAFARDHYPEDPKWALLSDLPVISEFETSPFKTHLFSKKYITSYAPQSGIIEANVGDTLQFAFEVSGAALPAFIVDSAYIDSTVIAGAIARDTTKQWSTIEGTKEKIFYVVGSANTQWLSIIYEDEMLMRYRLNVRQSLAASAN